jgi:predicted alpha/beta-hydrolase family hydrolase
MIAISVFEIKAENKIKGITNNSFILAHGAGAPADSVFMEHLSGAMASEVRREHGGRIFVGGKSMGGRMASLLAAEPDLADTLSGCVCFGYPFHPPGKPERWRVEHFDRFCCPVMIVQGTRDPFGKQEEVRHCQALSGSNCRIHWLEGGNHDFKPLARQPETQELLIQNAAKAAAAFMADHC